MNRRVADTPIDKVTSQGVTRTMDSLAVEEPLEIVLVYEEGGRPVRRSISVTMRTPGDDLELAAGFLFTEGIIRSADQIAHIRPFGDTTGDGSFHNVVRVELSPHVPVDLSRLDRNFYMSSSCGVCGKASIDAVRAARPASPLPPGEPRFDKDLLLSLPPRLREAQSVFDRTGALHAAALFDAAGAFAAVREDVGRHNAVDKLVGAELLRGKLPGHDKGLLVSGRASFELVQKALMAGFPLLAAVGAPSSLAVELAEEMGMTLVGFLRDQRFNIYAGAERVVGLNSQEPCCSSS